MKDYHEIKSYEKLVAFQRMMARDYPYYPIEPKDWDKLHSETLTVKGLEQLELLKSSIKMERSNSEEVRIYIILLELYVCSNPTIERLRDFKKEQDFHFSTIQGAFVKHIKNMRFPDLKKEDLVISNKKYSKDLSFKMGNWGLDLIQECYRIRELESKN